MQYDVFISCKSEDYKYAEEIYDFLTANGIYTFLASKELRKLGDSEYRKAISKALGSASHMIIFASKKEYIDSTWVYYEWDWFITAMLKGFKQGQILTILKDVKVNDINQDLWKYESFLFASYKEVLLSYVKTPESERRKEEKQKQLEEQNLKEKEKKQQQETKAHLVAMIEEYRSKLAALNYVDIPRIIATLQSIGVNFHTCPVCKSAVSISSTYCPTCGWGISPIDNIEGAGYLSLVNPSQLEIVKNIYLEYVSAKDHNHQFQNTLNESQERLKNQIRALEDEISTLKRKHREMISAKERIEQSYSHSIAKVQNLEGSLTNSQKELKSLRGKNVELQSQLGKATIAQRTAQKECLELKNKLIEKEKVLATTKQTNAGIQNLNKKAMQPNHYSSTYSVVLMEVGVAKLQVIKVVKEILGLGLGDAKVIVDNAPSIIADNVYVNKALPMKRALEEAGAKCECIPSGAKFDVMLISVGEAKLQVIKTIKDMFGLSLGDAKAIADSAPNIIAKNVSINQALALKRGMEAAGAEIVIEN
ncbi:MAG: ribosomal protein L7/L12 [Alistipes sp.]|nr:ribosomal protein L7/L12 [Alistipes sp.]